MCYRCAPNYDFGVIIYALCPSGGISGRGHSISRAFPITHIHTDTYIWDPLAQSVEFGRTSYDYRATNRGSALSISQFTSLPLSPETLGRGPSETRRRRRDRSRSVREGEGGPVGRNRRKIVEG